MPPLLRLVGIWTELQGGVGQQWLSHFNSSSTQMEFIEDLYSLSTIRKRSWKDNHPIRGMGISPKTDISVLHICWPRRQKLASSITQETPERDYPISHNSSLHYPTVTSNRALRYCLMGRGGGRQQTVAGKSHYLKKKY